MPRPHARLGDSLLLHPDLEQHSVGHSRRVVLVERKLTSYVYAVEVVEYPNDLKISILAYHSDHECTVQWNILCFSTEVVAAGIRIAIYIRQQVPTEGVTTGTGEPEIQNGLFEEKKWHFTYSEVLTITNNFARVLGSGGFGTVYHGCKGDMQVAVKKLSPSRVKLLMMVHHRNLTSLIGYCNEGSNMPLIYDYMSNRDFDSQLLDEGNAVLNWERRLIIAQDAAQGLDYPHNGCKPLVVHRDVKTTNILLNENFQAKLADFGLSRSFPTDVGSHVSTRVAGTPGNLDPALRGDFETNSVWKAVEIAKACVSQKSTKRPNMSQVVTELKDCLAIELARRNQGHATNTTNSIEALPAQITSELGPLAR
ncbi:hypothetical protein TIFTF001_006527 [Ficus carica]|uniref:Protein kinase domain-containing protein n=1 Tax=Ficus carica TaxID=3494 RepID=A0AA88CW38_FICCA|nr:hypothetical protein TIFTF001_006527 [Ficus carica]